MTDAPNPVYLVMAMLPLQLEVSTFPNHEKVVPALKQTIPDAVAMIKRLLSPKSHPLPLRSRRRSSDSCNSIAKRRPISSLSTRNAISGASSYLKLQINSLPFDILWWLWLCCMKLFRALT